MYNIAICEDNEIQLNQLENIFNKLNENDIKLDFNIDKYSCGSQLLKKGYDKYDIIILDIDTDKKNGIEIAKQIRKTNEIVKIIFITDDEQYWPQGYIVNAYRYFIKPLDEILFYEDLKKLFNTLNKKKLFILNNNEGYLNKIHIKDIRYLEILDRKVVIHTIEGNYTSNKSLRYWNNNLNIYGFSNPHNSFLVNLKYVRGLSKEKVTLLSGETVYVSQRKYKKFKDEFVNFVGGI